LTEWLECHQTSGPILNVLDKFNFLVSKIDGTSWNTVSLSASPSNLFLNVFRRVKLNFLKKDAEIDQMTRMLPDWANCLFLNVLDKFNFLDSEIDRTSRNTASLLPCKPVKFIFECFQTSSTSRRRMQTLTGRAGTLSGYCHQPVKFISECFQTSSISRRRMPTLTGRVGTLPACCWTLS
jgi:hypothetical protein